MMSDEETRSCFSNYLVISILNLFSLLPHIIHWVSGTVVIFSILMLHPIQPILIGLLHLMHFLNNLINV